MLLRDLFSVVPDGQIIKLDFGLGDYISGQKDRIEEHTNSDLHEYQVTNLKSNYEEDMIVVEVAYVN